MQNRHSRLIILGSGPAGYSAAVYAARANLKPTLIAGLQLGGQLTTTTEVDNWVGDAEGLTGPILMERMQAHAERFGTEMVYDHINEVDLKTRPFVLKGDMGEYTCDALIIATGATAQYLGLESEAAFIGQGVSACATCDGFFYKNKEVVALGGGDTALEEALYLSHICSKVYLVHRRDTFRASPSTVEKVKNNPKIELVLNVNVKKAYGDKMGLNGIIVVDSAGNERDIAVPGVFVFVGMNVNNAILKQEDGSFLCDMDENGNVVVDLSMHTSVKGLFAAGDLRIKASKQVVCAAGDGATAGIQALEYVNH